MPAFQEFHNLKIRKVGSYVIVTSLLSFINFNICFFTKNKGFTSYVLSDSIKGKN